MGNRLTVFDRHMERICRDTLRVHDSMVAVMGGPTKESARRILRMLGWTERRIKAMEGRMA